MGTFVKIVEVLNTSKKRVVRVINPLGTGTFVKIAGVLNMSKKRVLSAINPLGTGTFVKTVESVNRVILWEHG